MSEIEAEVVKNWCLIFCKGLFGPFALLIVVLPLAVDHGQHPYISFVLPSKAYHLVFVADHGLSLQFLQFNNPGHFLPVRHHCASGMDSIFEEILEENRTGVVPVHDPWPMGRRLSSQGFEAA